MTDLVRFDTSAGIATITFDSPHNRNALSSGLLKGLVEALDSSREDPAVRGVVLTGTGTTFCSGADLNDPPGHGKSLSLPELLTTIWTFPKPVIVRLNGHVRAGGTGLVAAADVSIAPAAATFAFSEVRIGVAPAIIAVVCARRMTPRALSRYMLTGEVFDAATAAGCGLITAAVPDDGLDAAVDQVLAGVRLAEPTALRTTKQLLVDLPTLSLADGFALTEPLSESLFSSPAAAEGIRAFKEKRAPSWAVAGDA
ncbi:MAG TPA: enoyl-CoA hydratase-related protein [Acidimicrobiia bacterium]|nr:enoyl-CoA hydratase-related protein [Acidimicrobiia bacterium]